MSVSQLAEGVGLLFQEFESQALWPSELRSPDLENLQVPTEEIRRRVTAALVAVGLSAWKPVNRRGSGGQKQRVSRWRQCSRSNLGCW